MLGASSTTTIKVPRELHARVSALARQHSVTMAEAISQAFDQAEEAEFWRGVRAMDPAEVQGESGAFDGALRDGLDASIEAGADS